MDYMKDIFEIEDTRQSIMPTLPRVERKIGRNDPCYCGSGFKYRHCHGTLTIDNPLNVII
jgi:uncharacterized protein YecA (UPF0149 family)